MRNGTCFIALVFIFSLGCAAPASKGMAYEGQSLRDLCHDHIWHMGQRWTVTDEPLMCKGAAGEVAGIGLYLQVVAAVNDKGEKMVGPVWWHEKLQVGSIFYAKPTLVSDRLLFLFRDYAP